MNLSPGTVHKSIAAHQLSASTSTLQVQLSLNTTDLPIPAPTITPTDLRADLPTLDGTAAAALAAQPQHAAAVAAPNVLLPLLNLGIGALNVTAAAPAASTPCRPNSCTPSKPCAYGCNLYTAHTTATKYTTAPKTARTPKVSITSGKPGTVQKANLASADLPATGSRNPTGVIAMIVVSWSGRAAP